MRLHPAMWDGLAEVCAREKWTLHEAAEVAQAAYRDRGLSSAVRTYLSSYFRHAATEEGHRLAGHGPAPNA